VPAGIVKWLIRAREFPRKRMNALATGQFPYRLNEPLALFLLRPKIFMNPDGPDTGVREFPIGAWATLLRKRSA
jgi:hypothetical protein